MKEQADVLPAETPKKRTKWWLIRVLRGWLDSRDRAEIFTDTAGAAINTGTAYWLVLMISGSIAVLGLALNSAAVVIGAMLIAPLLAPVVGLALALAIGDGQLAVETAIVVLASTLAVILTGALLAFLLPVPFQTLTAEIASRTRPTTLDLAIAAFSGLAGASVAVARKSKLSGAIPGVAVSVALVPPLAVAGYGIGTGGNWTIVRGSLLLYGANLAGIVMSAMVVFLVAGMRRPEVLEVDQRWRVEETQTALSDWIHTIPGLRRLGIMQSLWTRIGLVVAFVALVAIPLRASLQEIARETRIQRAVDAATKMFSKPGKSFIVSREVDIGPEQTNVVLNLATTAWFTDSARNDFERIASSGAGEPVTLTLEQLPASSGSLSQLATLIGGQQRRTQAIRSAPNPNVSERLKALRDETAGAIKGVSLPDSVTVLESDLSIGDSIRGPSIQLTYASPADLSNQVQQVIARQLAVKLNIPRLRLSVQRISFDRRSVKSPADPVIDSVGRLLEKYPSLRVDILAGDRAPKGLADSLVKRLPRARNISGDARVQSSGKRDAFVRFIIH